MGSTNELQRDKSFIKKVMSALWMGEVSQHLRALPLHMLQGTIGGIELRRDLKKPAGQLFRGLLFQTGRTEDRA